MTSARYNTVIAMKKIMDLQTKRRLEKFLELSALPVERIDTHMEFHLPPLHFYIEYVNTRVLFTMSRAVEHSRRTSTLNTLLRLCHPMRTHGNPLRAYLIGDRAFLSVSPAPEQDIKYWLACYQRMQRLLEPHPSDAQ